MKPGKKTGRTCREERCCFMVSEKMYDKLAELVVKKGVNVQKDQPVIIKA